MYIPKNLGIDILFRKMKNLNIFLNKMITYSNKFGAHAVVFARPGRTYIKVSVRKSAFGGGWIALKLLYPFSPVEIQMIENQNIDLPVDFIIFPAMSDLNDFLVVFQDENKTNRSCYSEGVYIYVSHAAGDNVLSLIEDFEPI